MCTFIKFQSKIQLRASNLQNFSEGMPSYPLIGKVAMLCASTLYLHPKLLTLTYFYGPPTIYHLPTPLCMYVCMFAEANIMVCHCHRPFCDLPQYIWLQFGRANLMYKESLTICSDVAISN